MARAMRVTRETLANQLAPMAVRMRQMHPRMHPLLQLVADIGPGMAEATADAARSEILKWVTRRSGRLPPEAWEFEGFSSPIAGRSAAGVRLRDGDLDCWIVRCDDPDKNVPGRNWQTEVGVIRHREIVRLTLRLLVATHEDVANLLPGVPGLVRQLAQRPGLLLHHRPLEPKAWLVDGETDAEALCELVERPTRHVPVVVVSLEEGGEDPTAALIDADALATRMLGIGIVAILSGPMTFVLTDRWGKQWSCFHRAIRVYRPGFDTDRQSPYEHPLILPRRVEEWSVEGGQTIADHLMRLACSASLSQLREDHDIIPFSKVNQAARQREREAASSAGRSDQDLLTLAEQELKAKEAHLAVMEDMMADEEDKRRQAEAAAEELRGENYRLKLHLDSVKGRLEALGRKLDDEVSIPSTLDEVREWADRHLAGRVVVTPRAARAAKRSQFQDIPAAYKALMFLANEYRAMRLEGGNDRVECADDALQQLRLQNEPTGDETRLREIGDEFLVDWRGRKRLLGWHLKNGGNTRDPMRCFRLYYFWDDEEELVVVGYLPSHLETRAT